MRLSSVLAAVDEVTDTASEAARSLNDEVAGLADATVRNLPFIVIGVLLAVVGYVLARLLAGGVTRTLRRTNADEAAVGVVSSIVRLAIVVGAVLLALSVAGVEVGPALAGLGIAGVAVAFALQGILENLIAGLILLARKPFRTGDQIITGEFEGTVEGLDLRVTRIIDYDGELVMVPNVDVYKSPLTNLTRRGKRRSRVLIGIDYRDDHDEAREVIRRSLEGLEGVVTEPAPQVLLTELADSSVNFEVRYWTEPDIGSVRFTQDRVLSAAKRAVEDAGMTIPWPIRTVVVDGGVRVERPETSR